jgi:hypothetical protein
MRRSWDPTVPAIITASVMVAGVLAATGGLGPGEWRATHAAGRPTVRVEMRLDDGGSHIRSTTDLPIAELDGFDAATFSTAGAPLRLKWTRDAGSFVLEGKGGRRASGAVHFEPSAAFRESWNALGLPPVDDHDLFTMALAGVRLADVQQLKGSGVDDLDARGVIELASDPDAMRWVTELRGGGTPLRLREVFLLRNHGVRPETFHEYAQSGLDAGTEEIVRLHDRGVDPDYVASVLRSGVGARDLEAIERLHDHGVPTEYVAGIRASGLGDAGVEDVIRLHDQGIDVDYVHGIVDAKLSGGDIEGIVRLHAHGVPVEYVRAVAEYGPGDRAAEDAIRLHDTGVPTEYMRSRATNVASRPSTDGTIRAWSRGGDDADAAH